MIIGAMIVLEIIFIYSFVYLVVIKPIKQLIEILKGKLELTQDQKDELEKLEDNARYKNEVMHL